uniref:Glycosyltransferase n=1 Tax=Quercus lobata TaxID=97700 RepID=A0A7N2LF29_QUELO
MDATQRRLSILMLPWLAHGHISPSLELSKKLTERSFHIYFCSTPINLDSIKPKLSEKYSHSIQLVELNLPSLPELPPQYHTTKGLPPHLNSTLKMAFDMASPSFSNMLKTLKPDLVIYDFLQPWAPSIAYTHNIPAVNFITTGAAATCFVLHAMKNPGEDFPFPELHLHKYMKGKYIDLLSSLIEKKVVPVGPLVEDPVCEDEKSKTIDWLDKKKGSSTVFVSFGSEYFLSKEEMEEIAHGLELSKVDFIWVVRFPVGEKIKLEEALPEGFLERVGERGIAVEDWAPQAKILRHSSIGGFVSHCGWSSVIESIKFGVPIIAIPMQLDQPLNARVVEEVGVGMEVKRDRDGKLERVEVATVIREVVMGNIGESIRRRAREMSDSLRKKGEEEIEVVVDELDQLCAARS